MEPLKPVFVIRIKLDPAKGDPREQIRRQTCDLSPGVVVRVDVRDVSAIPYGVPFVTQTDFVWYRRDLRWNFSSNNVKALASWIYLTRELDNA